MRSAGQHAMRSRRSECRIYLACAGVPSADRTAKLHRRARRAITMLRTTPEEALMSSVSSASLGHPAPVSRHADTAWLLIRLASAAAFLYHGSAILFGAFGGPGPRQFAAFMHWPPIIGYLVGVAQVFGGLAVLTGFLTRIGAACLVVVMLGA